MKNLLDSIWTPEDDNATIGIQMINNCIIISCGGPKPPREPDPSNIKLACEV